jgi:hypothetical protein
LKTFTCTFATPSPPELEKVLVVMFEAPFEDELVNTLVVMFVENTRCGVPSFPETTTVRLTFVSAAITAYPIKVVAIPYTRIFFIVISSLPVDF